MLYLKILSDGRTRRLAFSSLGQLLADDRTACVCEALAHADMIRWDDDEIPETTEHYRLPYGDVEDDEVFGLGSTPAEAKRAFRDALDLLDDGEGDW